MKKTFLISVIIFLVSCQNTNLNDFISQEKASIENNTTVVLKELNISYSKLLVISHSNYSYPVKDASFQNIKWSGTSIIPDSPPGAEGLFPPGYSDSEDSSDYSEYRGKSNFYNEGKKGIQLNYFSVVIFLDQKIENKTEIEKLLKMSVLNKKRGDTIFLVEK